MKAESLHQLRRLGLVAGLVLAAALWFLFVPKAEAASLLLNPSSGEFTVDQTFPVSIILDTEGETINTVAAYLSFAPDKLQVVSPSAGNSVIDIYTTPPRVNNQAGRLELAGGITGGVNAKSALIATITFRAKTPGRASVKILNNSQTLLHDGNGTDVMRSAGTANFTLNLPPSTGPKVSSDSHPDQDTWYSNRHVSLQWETGGGVDGYSYVFNDKPADTPDDIIETKENTVIYKNQNDGVHYFHIRAYANGNWSGTSHFAAKIDGTPPAEFPIEIVPYARTTTKRPYAQFSTTDSLSGLSRYEIKIVPLKGASAEESLFIEAQSPFTPGELDLGNYEVIVRAYDNAGNFRDVTQRLEIVKAVYRFLSGRGLEMRQNIVLPWMWIWIILILLIGVLIWVGRVVRKWHHAYHADKKIADILPVHLQQQLSELQQYQSKYGKLAMLLLAVIAGLLISSGSVRAQVSQLGPPSISVHPETISDEEIFYVGGRTEIPEIDVIIHVQNLFDGQTLSFETKSDKRADWFYRHSGFLSGGNYIVWTQAKIGEQLSPPSPQVKMTVQPLAFRFSGSRITYNTLYLTGLSVLLIICTLLIGYIIFHARSGRRRRLVVAEEVSRAEESIKRGFALLKRDLEAELAILHQARLSPALAAEQKLREQQLMDDLNSVQKYVGDEIWEVEQWQKKL